VNSTGFALGSVDLVVRDPRTSIEGTATVMFADLTPEAVYLNSDWVEDNGSGSGDIVLVRNAVTEAIQPGDILISGDKGGVLVRVLTASLTPSQVVLTVESATITDAFENLDIDGSIQAQRTSVRYSAPARRVDIASQFADGRMQQDSFALDAIECRDEANAPYPLQLSDATIDWNINIKLDGSLKINAGTVEEFSFFNVKTFTLEAADNTLSFGASLSGKVTCELPLPNYETPTLPISVFSFGLGAQPKLGVEVDGAIASPSFSISGPSGKLTSQVKDGIRYTNLDGWEPISEQSSEAQGSLFEADLKKEFGFTLGSKAYGGIGFELIANLGKGFLSYELARVEFVELLADVSLDSELKTPLDPMDRDYTGPRWDLAANVKGNFKAELTGGGLADLLAKLDVPVTIDIGGPIFDPVTEPLAGSPQLGSLALACTPSSCYLDTVGGDALTITLTTDGERSGRVDYLVSKDGVTALTELVSSDLLLSSSLAEWTPTPTTPDGVYRLYLRLETDALSSVLPYTLPTTEEHSFEVGPTATLTVEKLNQADSALIEGGRVTSAGGEIDCGSDCDYTYASGSAVTLTAEDSGGWKFVKWADTSDVCPGSSTSVCEATMSIDKIAKAVFEESLNYTFFLAVPRDAPDTSYTVMEEYASGDAVTVYNGMVYHMGLKLDGQPVKVLNFDAECCEISTNLHRFPTLDFGMTDHFLPGYEFTVRDLTNDRDVTFNIDLTVSNEGYRNIQGRTLDIKNYVLDLLVTVTYEPFPDGQQSGTLRQKFPDESILLGTWGMQGGNSFPWRRAPCDAGEQIIPVWGRITHNGWTGLADSVLIGPGHVWAAETWHFCAEFAQFRLVFGDH
jgi:hypothetical protein